MFQPLPLFAQAVYILCMLTSLFCTVLLLRGYRRSRQPLLMWSGLCFVFLSLNNLLLYVDAITLPTVLDLRPYRIGSSLIGVSVLLFGFVWDAE